MVVFAGRTRLVSDPATGGAAAAAAAVDEHVESLRQRWNQHGIEALIGSADLPDGAVVVRYRLSVGAGHAETSVVHKAFRDDLDRALDALSDRVPPPADAWDLASLAAAAATAAEDRANQAMPARVYESDTGDWGS